MRERERENIIPYWTSPESIIDNRGENSSQETVKADDTVQEEDLPYEGSMRIRPQVSLTLFFHMLSIDHTVCAQCVEQCHGKCQVGSG